MRFLILFLISLNINAAVVTLLDNTDGATALASKYTQTLSSDRWAGYSFKLNDNSTPSYEVNSITGIFWQQEGGPSTDLGLTIQLSEASNQGGVYKPSSLPIASMTFDMIDVPESKATAQYYTFNLNSSFSIDTNKDYVFTLGNVTGLTGTSKLVWAQTEVHKWPDHYSEAGGFMHNHIRSTSSGEYWTGATGSKPSFFLNGTAMSAVPEPHEYALVAGLGLLAFGFYRKKSVKAINESI